MSARPAFTGAWRPRGREELLLLRRKNLLELGFGFFFQRCDLRLLLGSELELLGHKPWEEMETAAARSAGATRSAATRSTRSTRSRAVRAARIARAAVILRRRAGFVVC